MQAPQGFGRVPVLKTGSNHTEAVAFLRGYLKSVGSVYVAVIANYRNHAGDGAAETGDAFSRLFLAPRGVS
jgi:hypothetical protein